VTWKFYPAMGLIIALTAVGPIIVAAVVEDYRRCNAAHPTNSRVHPYQDLRHCLLDIK
jgi:hypothetical protein